MSVTITVNIGVGDTPNEERPHGQVFVQLESTETVIAPPGGGESLGAVLAVVTAALDRLATSHLEEAKRQIEQMLDFVEGEL